MNTTVSARAALRSLCLALFVLCALVVFARAQEQPPSAQTAPPPAVAEPAPAAEPPAAEVPAEAPAPEAEADLRRLDEPEAATEPVAEPETAVATEERGGERPWRSDRSHGDERVTMMADNDVLAHEVIRGSAVAVMGDLRVDGEVRGDAVAVLGDNTVNGRVAGNVVAVLGTVTLGPDARVDGDVVSVGGRVLRDPASQVRGSVVQQAFGRHLLDSTPLRAWWEHALRVGRPLALAPDLKWLWVSVAATLVIYVLLALVFPRGVRRCGDVLAQRPGLTLGAAFLSILALPFLFVLLVATFVGIPVALIVLPLAVVGCVLFGKVSIYALLGRALTGDRLHPALAVVLGALIFIGLYLIPFVGLALALAIAVLGLGCAVTAMFTSNRKPAPVAVGGVGAPPPAIPTVPPMVAANMVAASEPSAAGAVPAPSTNEPPPPLSPRAISAMTCPRAGFWIRTGALFIDVLLMFLLVKAALAFAGPGVLLLALAIYGALMWRLKGTTIGGIVFGLKVVRLDDRPIDWATAIVRALSCFLSMIVAGLGFVWVAFDADRQSWHDKIAGTTVVKAPRGISLV